MEAKYSLNGDHGEEIAGIVREIKGLHEKLGLICAENRRQNLAFEAESKRIADEISAHSQNLVGKITKAREDAIPDSVGPELVAAARQAYDYNIDEKAFVRRGVQIPNAQK